jgi:hypothetical protein
LNQREGERYNDFTLPPLTQTLEEIQADFQKMVFLKAVIDDKIIGSGGNGPAEADTHYQEQKSGVKKCTFSYVLCEAKFFFESPYYSF